MFTAQEMRVRADYLEVALADAKTAAMLRQAADDLERGRKYEYAARYPDGHIPSFYYRSMEDLLDGECPFADEEFAVVRRSVGEWEEVPCEKH